MGNSDESQSGIEPPTLSDVEREEAFHNALFPHLKGHAEQGLQDTTRLGDIALPSWQLAEPEMQQIVDALKYPRRKPDWFAAVLSISSGLFLAAKMLTESAGKPEGWNLVGLIFGVLVSGMALVNTLRQQFGTSIFHERALEYARRMECTLKERASRK